MGVGHGVNIQFQDDLSLDATEYLMMKIDCEIKFIGYDLLVLN